MRSELAPHGDVVDLPASARAALATLADHPGVRAVIVFGSRARGDHDPRSDLDVAIDAPGLDPASLARIRDRISEFPTLCRITVTAGQRAGPQISTRDGSQRWPTATSSARAHGPSPTCRR